MHRPLSVADCDATAVGKADMLRVRMNADVAIVTAGVAFPLRLARVLSRVSVFMKSAPCLPIQAWLR